MNKKDVDVDLISTYIFILCAEIVSVKIKNNKTIIEIEIGNTEHLLSWYADYTKIIEKVSSDLNVWTEKSFYNMSGIKTIQSKTETE